MSNSIHLHDVRETKLSKVLKLDNGSYSQDITIEFEDGDKIIIDLFSKRHKRIIGCQRCTE